MPISEKEYNGNLFDQLSILERIEAVTDDEKALKQIAIERKQIERKLYQSASAQWLSALMLFHHPSQPQSVLI